MNTHRKTAIIVGVLFVIATVLGVLGNSLSKSVLDAPDYLVQLAANENLVITGCILVILGYLACAGIAIGLYPVLRKYNEALALGSVGFRVIEGVLYIIGIVGLLSLLTLSQEYAKAGASNASLFQASGTILLAIKTWAGQIGVVAFTFGGMMYYYVFYQSKLIPRWLSGWGFIGAALSLAAALLTISGQIVPFSTVFILLNLPIGLQEFVLAGWLITKGFSPYAITSLSAKTAAKELLSAS